VVELSWRNKSFSHDRYGSKAEIEGLYKELQRRHLNEHNDFQYQGIREAYLLRYDENYGKTQVAKKIRPDFSWSLPLKVNLDREYSLTAVRFLCVFLDSEEAHKGKQADRDFETDQFIEDQGSISLRYSYSGNLSETRTREIVDEIEAKHQEAQPP